jgi:uncharacterized protein (DUF305 family)
MTTSGDTTGDTTDETSAGPAEAQESRESRAMSPRLGIGIAAVLLALVVAVCAGLLVGGTLGESDPPATDSVDAGFARDMQVHHAQAVEMAYVVALGTENAQIRQIAFDIITTQQAQIGRMSGWLANWGLPAYSSEPVMAWMTDTTGEHTGHDTGEGEEFVAEDGAVMPGMATDTEMGQLRESTGREAEVLFLQLMVDHHRGGVDMAAHAAEQAAEPEVRLFADRVATSQEAEIQLMNELLVERGADPG